MNNQIRSLVQTPKMSAIVCAYNEEKTIEGVVESLLTCSLLDEVVVVNDGSTDQTKQVLSKFIGEDKFHCIHLEKNRGKGYAMTEGVGLAQGELILFVDADLLNLSANHLALLAAPLLNGEARMVMGIPIRGETISRAEILDPCHPLTGQRALWKEDFLPVMNVIRYSGYGVETILNLHFQEQTKPVKKVFLPFLTHLIKVEKTNLKQAVVEYGIEGYQILKTVLKNPGLVCRAVFSVFSKERVG